MSDLMSPEQLGEKVAPFVTKGADLLGQAERAVISNAEILAQAGDLYKIINTQIKATDEARTFLVKPLNDHVKAINAQFKKTAEPMNEAKTILKTKMDEYVAEETRIQEEANAKAKAEAEEAALKSAEKHEAAGDNVTAQAVVEAAADLPDAVSKAPKARGNLGSTTSSRTDWKGEVVDIKAFLQAIIDGHIPESFIEIKQVELDKLAKSRKIEKTNLGIKIYKKVSASIR